MATSNAFETSDTVEMKGTLRGVTRLSKKAKGLMLMGAFVLMCFILFSIFSMGDDTAAPSPAGAGSDAPAKDTKKGNEPAAPGDLLKGVSDGQAVTNAGPLDPGAPASMGPSFDMKTPQPAADAASGAVIVPGTGATGGTSSPAGLASPPSRHGGAAPMFAVQGSKAPPAGAIVVPSTEGIVVDGNGQANGPRRQTREELAAVQVETDRAARAQKAREGVLETGGAGWGGDQTARGGMAGLTMPTPDAASMFGGAANAAGLPRPMAVGAGGAPQDDPNKQQRKEQFLKDAQTPSSAAYLKQTVAAPASKYEVKAGWQIPVALESGVNTDLPGQIKARVRESVYDTATGQYLLIPQGTLAIGNYDSQISVGQSRVLVAWQRLIFPDGSSISLDGMPSGDQAGYAGLTGDVDNHYVRIFGSAIMMSVISAGVQLSQPQQATGTNSVPTAGQTIAGAVGQQLGQVSTAMIQRQMQVQPTITQEPGARFVIMVSKDVIFPGPYKARARSRTTVATGD